MLSTGLLVTAALSTSAVVNADLPSCEVYSENQCTGDQIITDPSFVDHQWYTPDSKSKDYLKSFQDYSVLAGHAHIEYDKTMKSAVVTIIAEHRDGVKLTYGFDGKYQSSNTITVSSTKDQKPISVSIKGADDSVIELDPIDLAWNAPPITINSLNTKGDYRDGQKGAIVELFMWPHTDVAKECEIIGKMGYMGVKLFPAMEQVMSWETFDGDINPWYFAYQPVSYRLQGRMGSRDQLRDAIYMCRQAGVRVYADAVMNHMTGGGNDVNNYHRNPGADCAEWGLKNSSLMLSYDDKNSNYYQVDSFSGPSPMYTQSYVYTEGAYTNLPPSQEFPAAHWGPTDFHCERPLNAWTDPLQLNAGWLSGLVDINTEKESVQERLADYLTDLISIGFSGLRIDAAKHIQPDDLVGIFTKLRNNLGGSLPDDFVSYLEVLLGGESELLSCDVDSGYNYGGYLENAFLDAGWSQTDVNKVKLWNSGYPKEPQQGFCTISKVRNAIQNDDHDQQNPGSSSRDMGDQGCVLIKDCQSPEQHIAFEQKLFDSPNGVEDNSNDYPIRLILSSYYWQGDSAGVPDGYSDCAKCVSQCESCKNMTAAAAYKADSCGYDSDYTRTHRNLDIVNSMREWMGLSSITAKDLGLSC